jgi:hypothetical protein
VLFVVLARSKGRVDKERKRVVIPAVKLLVVAAGESHSDKIAGEENQERVVLVEFSLGAEVGHEDLGRQQPYVEEKLPDFGPLKEKEYDEEAQVSDKEKLVEKG